MPNDFFSLLEDPSGLPKLALLLPSAPPALLLRFCMLCLLAAPLDLTSSAYDHSSSSSSSISSSSSSPSSSYDPASCDFSREFSFSLFSDCYFSGLGKSRGLSSSSESSKLLL